MKKKAYIQPQSIDTHLQVRLICDATGNNTYGTKDSDWIGGKERDDTEEAEEETDAWTNGLW